VAIVVHGALVVMQKDDPYMTQKFDSRLVILNSPRGLLVSSSKTSK
jgi:hypothetical protein